MKTVRRPPYPKWNPGYFPCSSLTPLPLSSRRPSVSFGGFGLKSVAQVMFADVGTRVYFAQHGSFDTHAGELFKHGLLWGEVAPAIGDFYDDLVEHDMADDTLVFMYSEFGRRIRDNGSGTDHGSGGMAMVIGNAVRGGMYGEYPSLKEKDQLEGDLHFNNDFRQTYTSIIDEWLGLDAASIVNGRFEPFDMIAA